MNNPIVDFYEGSGIGPTIRIDAQEISSIRVLADSNRKAIRIAPGAFEWRGTPDDWRDTRVLIIPLLKGTPSHQYLNNGPRDDATVEIAILEQRPVWLQRLVDVETMNDRQPATDNRQQG